MLMFNEPTYVQWAHFDDVYGAKKYDDECLKIWNSEWRDEIDHPICLHLFGFLV